MREYDKFLTDPEAIKLLKEVYLYIGDDSKYWDAREKFLKYVGCSSPKDSLPCRKCDSFNCIKFKWAVWEDENKSA